MIKETITNETAVWIIKVLFVTLYALTASLVTKLVTYYASGKGHTNKWHKNRLFYGCILSIALWVALAFCLFMKQPDWLLYSIAGFAIAICLYCIYSYSVISNDITRIIYKDKDKVKAKPDRHPVLFIDNDGTMLLKAEKKLHRYSPTTIDRLPSPYLAAEYDIVVCDLIGAGYGEESAEKELENIYKNYPYKYLIAISSEYTCLQNTQPFTNKQIWKNAANLNEFFDKLVQAIDQGIRQLDNPACHWEEVKKKLEKEYKPKEIGLHERAYALYLHRKEVVG